MDSLMRTGQMETLRHVSQEGDLMPCQWGLVPAQATTPTEAVLGGTSAQTARLAIASWSAVSVK